MKRFFLLLVLLWELPLHAQLPTSIGWSQLASTTINNVCACTHGFSSVCGVEGCAAIESWSGGVFDSSRNRAIIWGGGHAAYYGNELYAFNLNATPPTMTRLNDPGLPLNLNTDNTASNTQPCSRHTYDGLEYLPNQDRLFVFGGSRAGDGNLTNDTWTFSFASSTWTRMNPSGTIPANHPGITTAYDPNTGKVFAHDMTNLFSYDYGTNTWTRHSNNGSNIGYHFGAVIDPVRKLYVLVGPDSEQGGAGRVYSYDIATGSSYVRQTRSTTGGSAFIVTTYPGLAYYPIKDRIVGWNGGNLVYSLNLGTNVWTTTSFSTNPGASSTDQGRGAQGRLRYSNASGVFTLVNGTGNNAWILRLDQLLNGYPMTTLQNEKDAYTAMGLTWSGSAEPNYPVDSGYSVSDPDIHGDTEADDLWVNLHQYVRSGQAGYQSRLNAWASYMKSAYYNPSTGSGTRTFAYDLSAFGADHLHGVGLLDYYLYASDSAALTKALQLANLLQTEYSSSGSFGCLFTNGCIHYGLRQIGRHLLFITRLYQITLDSQWATLRDFMITKLLNAPEWSTAFGTNAGMYFFGDFNTDAVMGSGAYAAGSRIQSTFQVGIIMEAFFHAYRQTNNAEIKNRMVKIARFVDQFGLDDTYQYTASYYGLKNGTTKWHSYSDMTPVTFWAPAYTTSQVGPLVIGYKYSGEINLLNRAKVFFKRGINGIYGEPVTRNGSDSVASHFVDTVEETAGAVPTLYWDYNKTELLYTYLLFENGGSPSLEVSGTTPAPPTGFQRVP